MKAAAEHIMKAMEMKKKCLHKKILAV